MKRYGNIWEKITSKENLSEALRLSLRRKKKRGSVLTVSKAKDEYIERLQVLLQNEVFHPSGYEIKLLFERLPFATVIEKRGSYYTFT